MRTKIALELHLKDVHYLIDCLLCKKQHKEPACEKEQSSSLPDPTSYSNVVPEILDLTYSNQDSNQALSEINNPASNENSNITFPELSDHTCNSQTNIDLTKKGEPASIEDISISLPEISDSVLHVNVNFPSISNDTYLSDVNNISPEVLDSVSNAHVNVLFSTISDHTYHSNVTLPTIPESASNENLNIASPSVSNPTLNLNAHVNELSNLQYAASNSLCKTISPKITSIQGEPSTMSLQSNVDSRKKKQLLILNATKSSSLNNIKKIKLERNEEIKKSKVIKKLNTDGTYSLQLQL